MKRDNDLNIILKRELQCSMGCTEPAAIAYAVAYGKEQLPSNDEMISINVGLSSNVLKNALCVTIPNTNISGIDIIALLGLIKCKSSDNLLILSNITEEDINLVYNQRKKIKIKVYLIENVDSLYIDVELKSKNHIVKTIIEKEHNNIKKCVLDGNIILLSETKLKNINNNTKLSFNKIYEFIINKKFDKELIEMAKKYNIELSEYGLINSVGLNIGTALNNIGIYSPQYEKIISKTVAGIDARMSGVSKKIIINSGSGNQGITTTVPIVEFANQNNISNDVMISALALSHLITIYVRSKENKLSSACGAVCASAGVAAGIAFMINCTKEQIEGAVINFLCSSFGVFCDGAKSTCSLKVASAVSSAINSAFLAKNNVYLDKNYGVISTSLDNTLDSLSAIEQDLTKHLDKIIMNLAIKNTDNKNNVK